MDMTTAVYVLTRGDLAALLGAAHQTPMAHSPVKELVEGIAPTPDGLAAQSVFEDADRTVLKEDVRFVASVLCAPVAAIAFAVNGVGKSAFSRVYIGPGEGSRPSVSVVEESEKITVTFLPSWDVVIALLHDLLGLGRPFLKEAASAEISAEEYSALLGFVDAARERDLELMLTRLAPRPDPVTSLDASGALGRSLAGSDRRWAGGVGGMFSPMVTSLEPEAMERALLNLCQKGWLKATATDGTRGFIEAGPMEAMFGVLHGLISGVGLSVARFESNQEISAGSLTVFRGGTSTLVAFPSGVGGDSPSVSLLVTDGEGAINAISQLLHAALSPMAAPLETASARAFCTKCGVKLKPGARFCSGCGEAVK